MQLPDYINYGMFGVRGEHLVRQLGLKQDEVEDYGEFFLKWWVISNNRTYVFQLVLVRLTVLTQGQLQSSDHSRPFTPHLLKIEELPS